MRTKEFIKRVEELGFKCDKNEEVYFIIDYEGTNYGAVCHTTPNQISNTEREWDLLDKYTQEKLFAFIVEYAKTPIEEREEPKKYYLKHKWIGTPVVYNHYLNKNLDKNLYTLDDNVETSNMKTSFTLLEIDDIKDKYDTNLSDFKMIEVEE